MGLPEDLERLGELHDQGKLSDDEYANAKIRLLGGGPPGEPVPVKFVLPRWLTTLIILIVVAFVWDQCESASRQAEQAVNDFRLARRDACVIFADDSEGMRACLAEIDGG